MGLPDLMAVFLYLPLIRSSMAKKNDTGFQSSAGLMRYFDVENEKGLKVSPYAVIGVAIAVIVIVEIATAFFSI
jgi:preprotein translocase subunit Sec61beta